MSDIYRFILNDFRNNTLRFILELLAVISNITVALILLFTTPHPPMIPCYVGWLTATTLLLFCSLHRGSFGLTLLYVSYIFIDGAGLIRTLLAEGMLPVTIMLGSVVVFLFFAILVMVYMSFIEKSETNV
jgi:hypothetical protein